MKRCPRAVTAFNRYDDATNRFASAKLWRRARLKKRRRGDAGAAVFSADLNLKLNLKQNLIIPLGAARVEHAGRDEADRFERERILLQPRRHLFIFALDLGR